MKILYVCQYFPPEMGAHSARVSELAKHWVRLGHQVTVLTGFPNHPNGVVFPEYKARLRRLVCHERLDGINVVRTWLLPLPNRKPFERILNYTSFCLSSCLTGSFLGHPDIVIATSPQLLTGVTGWWLGRIKRVPFVLEIRDLWPESLPASGVSNPRSLLVRLLGALSNFLYRRCHQVVVVTSAMKDELVTKWAVPPDKISIVPNGVETDLFTPEGPSAVDKQAIDLQDKFVVSYIGTLGLAHGLRTTLEAASRLREGFPDIVFLFVGDGADRERLLQLTKEWGLTNVRFLGQQPRDLIPALIRASDLCLVLLNKAEVFKTVIPTKMLEFISCGRPIILGVDGDAHQLLDEAQAGIFIDPENSAALADTVVRLYRDAPLRRVFERNGRQYAVKHLSRERTAKAYTGVLQEVLSG